MTTSTEAAPSTPEVSPSVSSSAAPTSAPPGPPAPSSGIHSSDVAWVVGIFAMAFVSFPAVFLDLEVIHITFTTQRLQGFGGLGLIMGLVTFGLGQCIAAGMMVGAHAPRRSRRVSRTDDVLLRIAVGLTVLTLVCLAITATFAVTGGC